MDYALGGKVHGFDEYIQCSRVGGRHLRRMEEGGWDARGDAGRGGHGGSMHAEEGGSLCVHAEEEGSLCVQVEEGNARAAQHPGGHGR